jgi:glycosyltransferase involved in cell wall biosynthesis
MRASVLIITYNHGPYIAEAMECALRQETDFDFELVVGEDCSSDSTREVVRSLERAHPGRVRPLYHASNVGMFTNLVQTYRACRGEFIAMLEGDDVWSDRTKLQKQVDFLRSHPRHALCFNDALAVNQADGTSFPIKAAEAARDFEFLDLLANNIIPTCTVMYRNGLLKQFPEWLGRLRLCDWPLHLLHAEHGRIGYLPECMSTYRIHAAGVWSKLKVVERCNAIIDMYGQLDAHYQGKYHCLIQMLINYWQTIRGVTEQQDELQQLRSKVNSLEERLSHLLQSRGVRAVIKLGDVKRLAGSFLGKTKCLTPRGTQRKRAA